MGGRVNSELERFIGNYWMSLRMGKHKSCEHTPEHGAVEIQWPFTTFVPCQNVWHSFKYVDEVLHEDSSFPTSPGILIWFSFFFHPSCLHQKNADWSSSFSITPQASPPVPVRFGEHRVVGHQRCFHLLFSHLLQAEVSKTPVPAPLEGFFPPNLGIGNGTGLLLWSFGTQNKTKNLRLTLHF